MSDEIDPDKIDELCGKLIESNATILKGIDSETAIIAMSTIFHTFLYNELKHSPDEYLEIFDLIVEKYRNLGMRLLKS